MQLYFRFAKRPGESHLALDGKKVPPQRITDLEAATRRLRPLSCVLDSCTISASYEVSQAQKALLLMPRTAQGASISFLRELMMSTTLSKTVIDFYD